MFEQDWRVIITSAKLSVAWRFSMMLSIITGPLYLLVNYVVWKAVFAASGRETIGGFTFEQMIVYLVITLLMLYLTWDDVKTHLGESVRNGSFIMYLLKPFSYIRFAFMWKVGHRAVAFVLEFIPVMLILALLLGPQVFLTQHFLLWLGTVAIAFVILYLINLLLGMLAFWFVKTHGLHSVYRAFSVFLYGTLLPLSLYPQALQRLLFFTPFPFAAYVPARVFVGDYALAGIALSGWQVLAYGALHIIALTVICWLVWGVAIKRFQGVGA